MMELVAGFGITGMGKLLAGGMTVSNASVLRDILAQKRPDVLIESHRSYEEGCTLGNCYGGG